jgi:hypothetical protein
METEGEETQIGGGTVRANGMGIGDRIIGQINATETAVDLSFTTEQRNTLDKNIKLLTLPYDKIAPKGRIFYRREKSKRIQNKANVDTLLAILISCPLNSLSKVDENEFFDKLSKAVPQDGTAGDDESDNNTKEELLNQARRCIRASEDPLEILASLCDLCGQYSFRFPVRDRLTVPSNLRPQAKVSTAPC